MSARPEFPRLADEDLDLLVSRALDGDLSPDEEKQWAEVLAFDPRAAARRDEMARVVGSLHALPAPGAPLGLTARVIQKAAGGSSGLAGALHRVGFFPPPAMARGIAAVFAIVLVSITVMRSQSERMKQVEEAATKAGRDEGAVSVFFQDKKPAEAPSAAEAGPAGRKVEAQKPQAAPIPAEAPAADAPARAGEERLAARDRRQDAGNVAAADASSTAASKDEKAPASEADGAFGRTDALGERREAASNVVSRRDEALAKKAKVAQELTAAPAAPAVAAEIKPGAQAPAPAAAAPAPVAPSHLVWSISIAKSSGWMLKKAPESVPSRLLSARCIVSVDASGRVVSVRGFGTEVLPTEIADLARDLVFEWPAAPKAPGPADVEIEVAVR
ncbi:MAG TPA: hypothetical protein VLH41_02855 [Thermoanaerobaculia bacterium]|nr:hypothetical protein [Thermoanaerobaculia bacterium]